MADSWSGSIQSDDSYQFERHRLEPIYETFICPLTKQVMRDPVSIENGQTFERQAIEKWFRECREGGRKMVCPLTLKELRCPDVSPNIPLRNTIEEWRVRNETYQLEMARKYMNTESPEDEVLQALLYLQRLCRTNTTNKHVVRNSELIPMIVDVLKSSSPRVRCKALETLRVVVENDLENTEVLAEGDSVRTIVKFVSRARTKEREEAVALLFELSKSEALCEKIGSINGVILMLVGVSTSDSEIVPTVEKADKILENLEVCENNVKQMAESGRLRPLLNQILEGPPEKRIHMVSYLGDLVLNNELKVLVARTVGHSLVEIMRNGNLQYREAALRALNQISSCVQSARVLINAGILPPLVADLFTVGSNRLPMNLKEISATILANIIIPDCDYGSIPVGPENQTLVSEEIVHNLLCLISNTGPSIECKLLQVLVGLTTSESTIHNVVSAIRSSGAMISLVQFIEAPQKDLRVNTLKLLQNLSSYMGQDLANALTGTIGQLSSVIAIISENTGISEEQAAAVGLLAELPEADLGLTRQLLEDSSFQIVYDKINSIRQGETRGIRFMTPFLEGLVKVLSRVTYALSEEQSAVVFCREYHVAALFISLLQFNDQDKVQMVSAMALENLSKEAKNLTKLPETPKGGLCWSIFPCFAKQEMLTGLCQVHRGTCSLRETFCLVQGEAVEKLVALLDHRNADVVEAALAAISTLLDDGVNIEQGVKVLYEAEAFRPIFDVLMEKRTEASRRRGVWAVERLLRSEEIAQRMAGDQNLSTALVDAYQNADNRTRQIAEKALKHVDKIPNFSGIFPAK